MLRRCARQALSVERCALVLLACGGSARADRGALSVEGGGGLTVLSQPAPYASPGASTLGGSASFILGGRYGLSNAWEVTLSGFFEPPVTYWHNGVTTVTADGAFPGTLSESVTRFGGMAGARRLWGSVLKFVLGAELGWSHRSATKLDAINDVNLAAPVDYGLSLAGLSADNFQLSALIGLEWDLGDHYSLSVMPRLELLLGKDGTWAFTAPLTFAWSWYL